MDGEFWVGTGEDGDGDDALCGKGIGKGEIKSTGFPGKLGGKRTGIALYLRIKDPKDSFGYPKDSWILFKRPSPSSL